MNHQLVFEWATVWSTCLRVSIFLSILLLLFFGSLAPSLDALPWVDTLCSWLQCSPTLALSWGCLAATHSEALWFRQISHPLILVSMSFRKYPICVSSICLVSHKASLSSVYIYLGSPRTDLRMQSWEEAEEKLAHTHQMKSPFCFAAPTFYNLSNPNYHF